MWRLIIMLIKKKSIICSSTNETAYQEVWGRTEYTWVLLLFTAVWVWCLIKKHAVRKLKRQAHKNEREMGREKKKVRERKKERANEENMIINSEKNKSQTPKHLALKQALPNFSHSLASSPSPSLPNQSQTNIASLYRSPSVSLQCFLFSLFI